jgi:hypothetical protein
LHCGAKAYRASDVSQSIADGVAESTARGHVTGTATEARNPTDIGARAHDAANAEGAHGHITKAHGGKGRGYVRGHARGNASDAQLSGREGPRRRLAKSVLQRICLIGAAG